MPAPLRLWKLLEAASRVRERLRADTKVDEQCVVFAKDVIAEAYGLPGLSPVEWHIQDHGRPWSNLEAARTVGVATGGPGVPAAPSTVPAPPARTVALCQAYHGTPGGSAGHCWLWIQVTATTGVRLDAAETPKYRPPPGAEVRWMTWDEATRGYGFEWIAYVTLGPIT